MITVSTSKSRPAARYHHGDLREALIAAGLAILEEDGDPSALSLREAARRAGVSAMAPYRHFADKEALLAAVVGVGFERLARALVAADQAETAREALVRQGVAYVTFACANPALFRLMFGAPLPAKHEGDFAAQGEKAFDVLARRVADLVPAEDTRDWTTCCWAIAHGIAALAIDQRLARTADEDAGMVADRVLRLLAFESRGA